MKADQHTSVSHHTRSPQDTYNEFVERFDDAIVIYGEAGFVGCNDAALRLLGYERREQLMGAHPADISPSHQPDGQPSFEKAEAMLALAHTHGKHRFEWTHKNDNGLPIPVEVVLTPMVVDGKTQVHAVMRDISEQKALLDQLHQLQKLEAMGKLAGGIAHDFNNLLVVVMGRAELLQMTLQGDEANLKHADEIRRAGERAAAVVRQLLAFGRKQPVVRKPIDLNDAVRQSSLLLTPLLGEQVKLDLELAPAPLWVNSDVSQIEQVLMNLASNARDAMPGGGTLTIRTGADGGIEPVAHVIVTDTGQGMDHNVLANAVEPFYTTKPIGKGTGLGLSSVYGIVTQNEGNLRLDSRPGFGTTIDIALPICDAPGTSAVGRILAGKSAAAVGREAILLVEDDEAVFSLATLVLRSAGYRVVGARDGAEAWNILNSGERVQVVLSDVVMPNKTGPELQEAMRSLDKSPPIIFMSGFTGDQLREQHQIKAQFLLEKPFTSDQLLDSVRSALDRAHAES